MKVLVMYQSRKGHTRQAAQAIAETAREMHCEVTLKSIAELRKIDVDQADALFIGTWVHGLILFGVHPAGADQWVPSLPDLNHKPIGIFCTYAFHPRGSLKTLEAMLKARGAKIVGQHAFQRSHVHDGTTQFVEGVLKSSAIALVEAY